MILLKRIIHRTVTLSLYQHRGRKCSLLMSCFNYNIDRHCSRSLNTYYLYFCKPDLIGLMDKDILFYTLKILIKAISLLRFSKFRYVPSKLIVLGLKKKMSFYNCYNFKSIVILQREKNIHGSDDRILHPNNGY
jgi:hypothetical protein